MKIVFYVPRHHSNMIPWVKALQDDGNDISIWADYIGPSELYDYGTHVSFRQSRISKLIEKVFGQGGGHRPYLFAGPFSLFIQILKQRPDVIIIREPKRFGSAALLILSSFFGIKRIIYSLSDFNKWSVRKTKYAKLFVKLFRLSWVSPVPVVKMVDSPPFYRLPFIIQSTPSTREEPRAIRVLMVGKYGEKRKNHELLIRAIARVHLVKAVCCTVIGSENPLEAQCGSIRLAEFANQIGLSSVVDILVNIPHREMAIHYQNADLFVLPASDEPAGIVVIEALGFGLPVICSDSCGLKTYVDETGGGIVFKADDLDSLVECILVALQGLGQLKANAALSHEAYSEKMFLEAFYKIVRAS